jgi:hypothetical protein
MRTGPPAPGALVPAFLVENFRNNEKSICLARRVRERGGWIEPRARFVAAENIENRAGVRRRLDGRNVDAGQFFHVRKNVTQLRLEFRNLFLAEVQPRQLGGIADVEFGSHLARSRQEKLPAAKCERMVVTLGDFNAMRQLFQGVSLTDPPC